MYRTIAALCRFEPEKVKGSRHLATAAPVEDEDAVERVLTLAREYLPEATHHAFAWRLGRRGERYRFSDDGEPGGSAGRPILQAIESRDLCFVLVVVSRVFGGTRLGVGGLMRAYGGAAQAVLERADIKLVVPEARLRLRFDYALSGTVEGLLHAARITPFAADYGERVALDLALPEALLRAFRSRAIDLTSGRIEIEELD